MNVKREVPKKNRKFTSNLDETYFFTNSNGKLNTRKHMGNTTEILGKQFWNNWRATRRNQAIALLSPRSRDFALKMCCMFVICEMCVLSQLWCDWKATHEIEWLMKPACLLASFLLRKLMRTLALQPKPKNNKLFCYFVGVLCIFFLEENLFSRRRYFV